MHVLFIGAHPDDAESSAGGALAAFAAAGHHVKMLSVTNGDAGHFADEYRADRSRLADRRRKEAAAAATIIGADSGDLDVHDGEVMVDLETTQRVVRAIRRFGPSGSGPDVIITHRPVDYHRDHRYTSRLTLDAAYVLTVPLFCPDVPHLRRDPVILYHQDGFTEGGAFRPDIAVDTSAHLERKARMLTAHVSQFFEWLPYNAGRLEAVPAEPEARYQLMVERARSRAARAAELAERSALRVRPANPTGYVELFQLSEYGRQPNDEELGAMFAV